MSYDDAKEQLLRLLPEMGDLYVRSVDEQLLLVRHVDGGVVIVTYGIQDYGPAHDADGLSEIQRWVFDKWIAAVTARTMRRATIDDVRACEGALSRLSAQSRRALDRPEV